MADPDLQLGGGGGVGGFRSRCLSSLKNHTSGGKVVWFPFFTPVTYRGIAKHTVTILFLPNLITRFWKRISAIHQICWRRFIWISLFQDLRLWGGRESERHAKSWRGEKQEKEGESPCSPQFPSVLFSSRSLEQATFEWAHCNISSTDTNWVRHLIA